MVQWHGGRVDLYCIPPVLICVDQSPSQHIGTSRMRNISPPGQDGEEREGKEREEKGSKTVGAAVIGGLAANGRLPR